MKVKILMVDNHPLQIEGYKAILKYSIYCHCLKITAVFNSKDVYDAISTIGFSEGFDVVFLDYDLPPYPEKGIQNGEDWVSLVKRVMPKAKIVMITAHLESFLLYSIVKKINPSGLFIKSDLTAEELILAFEKIMAGEIHYTQSVRKNISFLLQNEYFLDNMNRSIIILLSQSYKTKSIHKILNVSQSTIEKRKVIIKSYFKIEKGRDEDIVNEARRLGYI